MQYLKNVVTLKLTHDLCVGCGRCLEVCPRGVFQLDDRKAMIVARDACMECGACARNCPVQALFVRNGVGCAVGLLNAKLGRPSACCGGDQSCCCSS